MIKASRVEAARDEADRMARTIQERRREEQRLGQNLGSMVGIEGGGGYGSNNTSESEISPYGTNVLNNNNDSSQSHQQSSYPTLSSQVCFNHDEKDSRETR